MLAQSRQIAENETFARKVKALRAWYEDFDPNELFGLFKSRFILQQIKPLISS